LKSLLVESLVESCPPKVGKINQTATIVKMALNKH